MLQAIAPGQLLQLQEEHNLILQLLLMLQQLKQDSGTITSGFGSINNGSSNISTSGTVQFGSLSDGMITITGFIDEDNMTSNSATLIPTQQSVKAYVTHKLELLIL